MVLQSANSEHLESKGWPLDALKSALFVLDLHAHLLLSTLHLFLDSSETPFNMIDCLKLELSICLPLSDLLNPTL